MASKSVTFLLLTIVSDMSWGQLNAECLVGVSNPFGQCGCEGQFFMNANCHQGYVCGPTEEDGCLYECEGEYEIMQPHFKTGTFECIDNTDQTHRCPGAFNIHCEDDPIPELPLDWSQCDCDGQLWISPDCKQGFSCRNGVPGDGYFHECTDPGEILSVNFRTWNWGCQEDEGQCPDGFGGFEVGCQEGGIITLPTTCYETDENPLGICECHEQVFISDDCTQAFECLDDERHELINDGCLYTCREHEIMIPDFYSGKYLCMDNTENDARCTGQWHLHCEDNPVDTPITDDVCRCDGQLWVAPDCSEGFSCREGVDNGGYNMTCNEGEIIELNLRTYNWGCQPDNGNCPGMGGFSVGCETGAVRVPSQNTTSDENPIGICECQNQVFMDVDCKQAFKCDTNNGQGGTLYTCGEGELMIPEFSTGLFMCIDNLLGDGRCPGEFQTFCSDDPVELDSSSCECEGQLWVSPDCTEAFQCRSMIGDGGFLQTCPDGETIHYGAGFIQRWECSPGSAQCPEAGGYSLGCPFGKDGDTTTIATSSSTSSSSSTTPTSSSSTTTPTSSSSSSTMNTDKSTTTTVEENDTTSSGETWKSSFISLASSCVVLKLALF